MKTLKVDVPDDIVAEMEESVWVNVTIYKESEGVYVIERP